MKYEEAKEIGIECGLSEPCEFVNNIILHFWHLIDDYELQELRDDAAANGVAFSKVCGDATFPGGEDKLCYMCKNFVSALCKHKWEPTDSQGYECGCSKCGAKRSIYEDEVYENPK